MINDGFLTGQLGTGGYNATHRGMPRHVAQRVTPNFEKKEGQRFGPFVPAPFLPSLRLEVLNWDHFVITAGSPVATLDNGYLVPAGYKHIVAAGKNQGPVYKEEDVIAGVKNALGAPAVIGEYVVNSIIDAGLTVGQCIGVASYDIFMQLNGDPHNPATYKFHNYNRQNSAAVLTNYLLEFPVEPLKRTAHVKKFTAGSAASVVALDHGSVVPESVHVVVNNGRVEGFTFSNASGSANDQLGLAVAAGDQVVITYLFEETFYQTPYAGMTTWRGAAVPGALVTFNADSKFVMYTPGEVDDSDLASVKASVEAAIKKEREVVGVITEVDAKWPKQLLNFVKTPFDPRLYSGIINPQTGMFTDGSGLDRMPGSATDGVPHAIHYAGGDLKTGMVTFKLKL